MQGTGVGHRGPKPGMVYGVRQANLSPPVLVRCAPATCESIFSILIFAN